MMNKNKDEIMIKHEETKKQIKKLLNGFYNTIACGICKNKNTWICGYCNNDRTVK